MLSEILSNEWRFLTFRRTTSHLYENARAYLFFGLSFTWLAGVGRYWDNPRADLWQYLGLGSVAYVFVLAAVIWILVLPLRPKNWSYSNVLLFVTLTAPPAVLYAIPVERFMPLELAASTNAWFLAVVALWRVSLYVVFLYRTASLDIVATGVATLLPLVIIVVSLMGLNLEHVVFDIMSGIRPEDRTQNDAAYAVVFALSLLSVTAAPIIFIAYVVLSYRAWRGRRGA